MKNLGEESVRGSGLLLWGWGVPYRYASQLHKSALFVYIITYNKH